jgi:Phage integrase family
MPQFIQALEQEENDYARHGIWLLLLMGVRCNELLKAKWVDIDWIIGTLFIGLTKNGEPLLAPLSAAALERLRAIPRIANNPYIICGRDPGKHLSGLGRALKQVLKRAGMENVRIHDLRRTVGSWLAQAGRSLHLIGDVLNQKDPKTTAGYAYFQTQQRREALTDHGERVLAPADVTTPVSPDARPESQSHYFKRETLYGLVWTAPVMEVAGRLGVSDVALAKLCRRANIPTPARGYWARTESGQQISRPPLPTAPEGLPELLRIRGTRRGGVQTG